MRYGIDITMNLSQHGTMRIST